MPPEWVSMTGKGGGGGGSTWPTGNAVENLREARLAQGGGWREENISLLSSADLDVQKEETSVDLTSTHLLRVELKTGWQSGSLAAFSRPISTRGPLLAALDYKWHSCWAELDLADSPQPNTLLKNEPSQWCRQLASHTSSSLNLGLFVQSRAGGGISLQWPLGRSGRSIFSTWHLISKMNAAWPGSNSTWQSSTLSRLTHLSHIIISY